MAESVISYLHPHMQTSVVDNSTVIDQQVNSGTAMFMPYFSSRGIDGKIERYTSYSQFLADKGAPNFKKHGQAIYNILQFLRGGGVVYCTRILPEDAKAAQAVIGKKLQGYDAQDAETVVEGQIKYYKLVDSKQDGDKLLTFSCKGRGEYGNKISANLRLNTSLTSTYNNAVYELSVIESGVLVEGPYYVALNPEARDLSGASMFIEHVVGEYSDRISVELNEDKYDALCEELVGKKLGKDAKAALEVDDIFTLDFLGASINGIAVQLEDGTEGEAVFTKGKVTTKGSELLAAAFGHKDLKNKRQYPIDILMDANFEASVKSAMVALANERGDVFSYFDVTTAKSNSVEAALQGRNEDTISDRKHAVYGQSFVIHDSFTNSDVVMSATYLLAYKVPANDATYGIQYPLAGPARGTLTGFKSMSFNPSPAEKEELYKARVNYAEQDYRTTKLMSQLTAQEATSALSNINNMRVLLRMIRRVEEISENYFFEFASPTTLTHFQSAINSYLSTWVSNGACTSCEGKVFQNDYDVAQKVVRVSVELVFTGIIERIVIEFNVGDNK